jgi:hypothetical protein
MKTVTILTLFTLASCIGHVKQNDSAIKTKYQVISESTISLGSHNSILDIKPTIDNNYLLYLRTTPKDNPYKQDFYFLKISPTGDSLKSLPIRFEHFLTDYIELDGFFYVVTTDIRTMGGDTKDILSKYDKNWVLIWVKKIEKPKYPDGSTVLTLTKNKEILLIANEFIPNTTKSGISIRRYNLEGELISENFMLTKDNSNPISITSSSDANFYLTAEQYDQSENINSLWLMKLSQKGDTIWTKKYPHFYSRQTALTSNGDLVFYGSNFSSIEEQNNNYEYLKIIVLNKDGDFKWQRDIKQNYYERAGNFIVTKDGNYLFASTITPIKDKGDKAFVFELTKNGELTFERKFEYTIGISSVPYLIKTKGQVTLVGQKWIGQFGEPFKDIIQITKLTE